MFADELTKQLVDPSSQVIQVYELCVDGPKYYAKYVSATGAVEGCREVQILSGAAYNTST